MTDDALIKKAQNGDAKAFEALVESHYDTLFRFAYKWCGNREDAEDVAQQACIKLARALSQFRFESTFTSWLYRLVINCAKDWQKSQARHQHQRLIEETDDLAEVSSNEPASACSQTQAVSSNHQAESLVLIRQLLQQLDQFPDGVKAVSYTHLTLPTTPYV